MVEKHRTRVHLIAGGYPPGQHAGHDMDYARLRILQMLGEDDSIHTTVGGDYTDIDKWLQPDVSLLITYVAGPFAGEQEDEILKDWIDRGGKWLSLHGSSGGQARKQESGNRKMIKHNHHRTMGGFFINHPPIKKFTVDVADTNHVLTQKLPASFDVVDEPYMIELQQPDETNIVLTAALGPDDSPPGFGFEYESDTALQPDGVTRVITYEKKLGDGAVTYISLGHCHTPLTNQPGYYHPNVAESGVDTSSLRETWKTDAFPQLLQNGIEWGRD